MPAFIKNQKQEHAWLDIKHSIQKEHPGISDNQKYAMVNAAYQKTKVAAPIKKKK